MDSKTYRSPTPPPGYQQSMQNMNNEQIAHNQQPHPQHQHHYQHHHQANVYTVVQPHNMPPPIIHEQGGF